MLSIQKCPADKTRPGYVPPSTFNTPSTSKTIFVKLVILESPPSCVDKEKTIMEGEVLFIPQPLAKLPIKRKPPTCHHCGELEHTRPKCPHREAQRKTNRQALKTPMCHQCGVSSHVQPKGPPPQTKPPRHHEPPPRNPSRRHQQAYSSKEDLGPQEALCGETKDYRKGTPFVSSFMRDLVKYLEL
jgi:hypothetical protein